MKLNLLCDAVGILCPPMEREREITAIVSNSKDVTRDCLFVCIKGLRTDSHTLIDDVVAAGAACILTEEGACFERFPGVIYLSAPSTRRALALLYHAWYGYPTKKLKIIGVTGTNGKTTVTHMLRSIMEASLYKCGLIGTVGCESDGRCLQARASDSLANMTTPDPEELYRIFAEMVADGVEYVLMEVTSHALALGKLEPIRFEAAIFTNLTPDHLDFHGSMDAYAEAKAMLFTKCKHSIINLDSPWASRMMFGAAGRLITCSANGKNADYMAEDISLKEDTGVSYGLRSQKSQISIHCPMPGKFTVFNSLQAAACALELGISPAKVKDALASMRGVKGRMERVKLGPGADFSVLIDYAHTPDALENLLRCAREMKGKDGRLVLVFGCGGDRDRGKRPMMGYLASTLADLSIVTSDNSRSEEPFEIIEEILSGMDLSCPHAVIPSREDAIDFAVQNAKCGDLILLAGKGHEEYEITREGRRSFSEKELTKAAFAKRLGRRKNTDVTENEL